MSSLAEMENFHNKGEGGEELYRVAIGINLNIREEPKNTNQKKTQNLRDSTLVSKIHIEILMCLVPRVFIL